MNNKEIGSKIRLLILNMKSLSDFTGLTQSAILQLMNLVNLYNEVHALCESDDSNLKLLKEKISEIECDGFYEAKDDFIFRADCREVKALINDLFIVCSNDGNTAMHVRSGAKIELFYFWDRLRKKVWP